jgi:hypothetical protein
MYRGICVTFFLLHRKFIQKIILKNHSNKLLRAFYDQNEFVRDNEMGVLVDTEEEQVVEQVHLDRIEYQRESSNKSY